MPCFNEICANAEQPTLNSTRAKIDQVITAAALLAHAGSQAATATPATPANTSQETQSRAA